MNDAVHHPKHYTSDPSGVECIEITRHRTFNIGNAMKYLWRAGLKDVAPVIEHMNKAIWYIRDEIGRLEGKQEFTAIDDVTIEDIVRVAHKHGARVNFLAAFETDRGILDTVNNCALVLLHAFGVDRIEQIQVKFLDHIPHPEVTIPLMRAIGGPWQELLNGIEAFTKEQKAKATGAGAGVQLEEEGKKAVAR